MHFKNMSADALRLWEVLFWGAAFLVVVIAVVLGMTILRPIETTVSIIALLLMVLCLAMAMHMKELRKQKKNSM